MNKKIIFAFIPLFLTAYGCSAQNNTGTPKPGLANPASVSCLEKGGKLEIKETPAGQQGICRFSDGSFCDEWAFFRGECKPGQNK